MIPQARALCAHAEYARKIRVAAEHRKRVLAVFSRRFRMIMDLASALLSPQNRRLFKFHNLANPEQELLLETFKGTEALSWAFNYELLLVCEDSGVPLMMG